MALWEDESLFGKDTVTDYFKDLMTTKLPVFQDTIQLDKLWVYLRQYKVVNLNDQKRIKVENRFYYLISVEVEVVWLYMKQ